MSDLKVTSSSSPKRKRNSCEKSDSTSTQSKNSDSELNSVDERERDGSSSECSLTDIPLKTSQWTENHLRSLGVEVVSSSVSSPVNMIENVFPGSTFMLKHFEIDAKQYKKEILYNPPQGWENLKNYKSISDIFETDLDKLESTITDLNKCASVWLPHQKSLLTKWFTFTKSRFYIKGDDFGRYLLYMADTKQGGEMITEKMYQMLFSLFLGMFGLLGNLAPPARKIEIKSENVESVPDMLVSQELNVESVPDMLVSQAGKTLAVIEIKKFKKNCVEEMEPPLKSQKTSTEKDGRRKINHLDEHIVGQTGGDMLAHLKATASDKKNILGIMVQETFVTFTSLEKKDDIKETENEAENIFLKGDYIMKFSKPYNYLDPEDREDLFEPLMLLSLLQNNPIFLKRQ